MRLAMAGATTNITSRSGNTMEAIAACQRGLTTAPFVLTMAASVMKPD